MAFVIAKRKKGMTKGFINNTFEVHWGGTDSSSSAFGGTSENENYNLQKTFGERGKKKS